MRLVVVLVLATLAALPFAGAVVADSPPPRAEVVAERPLELRRLDGLLGEVGQSAGAISAWPRLLLLDDLDDQVPAEVLEAGLAGLAASRASLHPQVAAQLDWRLAELDTKRGRDAQAAERLAALGMLTKWHVVGPFDNDGLFTPHAPEEGIDPQARHDGRFEGLQWRPLESQGRVGYVRLGAAVAPTIDTTSYLATVVESPSERDAILWLGVDGAYRVWHGAKLVGERRDDLGGHVDRDGWRVRLKKGPNLLVVKVLNEEGNAGLYARLSDAGLAPLPLVHGALAPQQAGALQGEFMADAPQDASQRKKKTPAPRAEEVREALHVDGPLEALEGWYAALPDDLDARSRAEAMAWVALARARLSPGGASVTGQGLVRQALELAPDAPRVVELAALTLDEPWRRRAALEGALATDPDHALWLALRVEELLRGSVFDRADDLEETLQRLQAMEPDSVAVGLLVSEWYASQGLVESAYGHVSGLHERWPTTPAVLDELAWRAQSVGRFAARQTALEGLLAVRGEVDGYRDELASVLVQRGEEARALEVLEAGLRARPDAEGLALRRIELLAAQGQHDAARAAWQPLLEAVPTSASLQERYGNWLLAQGDQGGALEAWRASLALETGNESLRQMVRYLDPSTESFERPWVLTDLSEIEPADTAPGADYGVALDQRIVLVHPNGLSSTYVQTVYDVLNEEGASQLRYIPIYYTPEEEVLEVDTVRVVKPDGSMREVYERHEYSVSDEAVRMYYDYRQQIIELTDLGAGDRLEIRYRKSQTSQVNYFDNHFGDVWFVQDTVARGHARYVLIVPAERELSLRLPDASFGLEHTTQPSEDGKRVVHVFERHDVPAVEGEPMMPGFAEVAAYVVVSTFGDWGEVARWYWKLARDQWVVDAEIRKVVDELTAGVEDRREIVSRIHNYVVKNTRYVALEFGVHGYKPYRTTVCFKRRFGDCKDKASLIKVMLEEAGVPSDIVLVRTRRNGQIATDPATLRIFDHAIAYVPEFDLFLDGTAEFSGTTELPSMDQGITVLIVKDGGEYELRTTPVLASSASMIENRYAIALGLDGATIEGRGRATGEFAPGYRQRYESKEKRRDLFEDEMAAEYPGTAIETLEFEAIEDLEAPVAFTFSAKVGPLVRPGGDVLTLYPHGHSADLAQRLAPSAKRSQDLVLPFAFAFHNVFDYRVPAGYALEGAPEPVVLETEHGRFSLSVTPDASGEGFRVETRFALEQTQIPAAQYAAFRDFVMAADRTLNTRLRLVPTS